MIIVSATKFHIYCPFSSVLNVKALVGQEKALVGAFSVIVKTGCGTDGALHTALVSGVGTRGPVDTGTPAAEATWAIGHSDQGLGV